MNYWPFWISGLALAGVMLVHFLTTGRMMAVSGRFSSLVNRLRYADDGDADETPLGEADLVAAIRAMTAETFGAEAVEAGAPATPSPGAAISSPPTLQPVTPAPQTGSLHLLFFGSLALGGLLSAVLWGSFGVQAGLRSSGFTTLFGEGWGASAALLSGGILTGFGTRMAGGCTSGHGLVGVSRLQPGSLLATAAFFGAGIVVSLGLEALL